MIKRAVILSSYADARHCRVPTAGHHCPSAEKGAKEFALRSHVLWRLYLPHIPRTFPFEGTKVLVKLENGQIFRARFFEASEKGRFSLHGRIPLEPLPDVVEWAYCDWPVTTDWSPDCE